MLALHYLLVGSWVTAVLAAIPVELSLQAPTRKLSGVHLAPRYANGDLTGSDGGFLSISLTIGSPPQGNFNLMLDTGSYNTWVHASNFTPCPLEGCGFGLFDAAKSSTFNLKDPYGFYECFNAGCAKGSSFFDSAGIGGAVITNMSLDMAVLTDWNVSNGPAGTVGPSLKDGVLPPILAALLDDKIIDRAAFGLFTGGPLGHGEILFGGIDRAKYSGQLKSTNMHADSHGVQQLVIALTGFFLNDALGQSHSLVPDAWQGARMIFDTGNPGIDLPADLFDLLSTGMGAVTHNSCDFALPCDIMSRSNASLSFAFGGAGGPVIDVPISELNPFNQTLKYFLVNLDGAILETCCTGISRGHTGGSFGYVFNSQAYIIFDYETSQFALAPVAQNIISSNIVDIPSGTKIPGVDTSVTYSLPNISTTAPAISTSLPWIMTTMSNSTGYAYVAPSYDLGVSNGKAPTRSTRVATATTPSLASTSTTRAPTATTLITSMFAPGHFTTITAVLVTATITV